jgi:hypothetical protein
VDTRGHGVPAADEVRWRSSLQGEIGFGLDVLADLAPGRHTITVTAPDGLGNTIEERGIIIVGG